MIVTCPVCSTRYLVDPLALGAGGRLVRCAQCAHTWHQTPPADAPRRVDLPLPEVEAPSLRGPGERAGLPAIPPATRSPWGALSWILPIAVVVALAAGVIWGRDQVVSLWPPAARFYTLVGFPVLQPGSGLELRKVTPTREVDNGLPTLVIQGEVANVSNIAREVPKLKVILRDKEDHELQSWAFSVTDERLLPGASIPFRTSIAQPSEAATGVVVTFVGTAE